MQLFCWLLLIFTFIFPSSAVSLTLCCTYNSRHRIELLFPLCVFIRMHSNQQFRQMFINIFLLVPFALYFTSQTADCRHNTVLCISLLLLYSPPYVPSLAIANLNAQHVYISVVVIFHKMKNFNLIFFPRFIFHFCFCLTFFISWIVGRSSNT